MKLCHFGARAHLHDAARRNQLRLHAGTGRRASALRKPSSALIRVKLIAEVPKAQGLRRPLISLVVPTTVQSVNLASKQCLQPSLQYGRAAYSGTASRFTSRRTWGTRLLCGAGRLQSGLARSIAEGAKTKHDQHL